MKKIKVTSLVPYRVGLIIPEHRFSRNFTEEGQTILVDDEILREGLYNRGVLNLFKKGILKIEDKDFRIEVGLEDPEQKTEVKTLNSTQMLTLLKVKPFKEFESTIKELSDEQLDRLVSLAVENKITDYEKCKLLKEVTGKDVMQIIRLNEDE